MLNRRSTLAAGLWLTAAGAARAQSAEPILIGCPLPLTGVLAVAGQTILAGTQYAVDQANKSGGVLGRPLKLLVEDTKSEPNTAATVATKLASEDKVFAFVGGFGSTADFAMLQSLRRYHPIFIHVGSSSVKLEQAFGKEDWYYHVYIWDYHRQKAAASLLSMITPKPKTVAMAHEDGLYGSDAAKYAQKYLTDAGFQMVMSEPFKAGSPDFSPILTRLKSLNPDIFYFVGYSGDNIQVVRQSKSLGVRPKLTIVLSVGDKRSDYGDFGNGLGVIAEWAPEENVPGNTHWTKDAMAATGLTTIVTAFVQGYAGMITLLTAIKAAGSVDSAAVLKALDTSTFDTPFGKLKYHSSEGGAKHQLLDEKTMLLIQYTPQGEAVVLPPEVASGKLVYPAP